jgi:hypothetical protein
MRTSGRWKMLDLKLRGDRDSRKREDSLETEWFPLLVLTLYRTYGRCVPLFVHVLEGPGGVNSSTCQVVDC